MTASAQQFLPLLDDSMQLLDDRGFDTDDFLAKAAAAGAQLLVRLKAARTPARWAPLPDGTQPDPDQRGPAADQRRAHRRDHRHRSVLPFPQPTMPEDTCPLCGHLT